MVTEAVDHGAWPGDSLPTGVTVLHYSGDGPAPVERLLEASPVERDPVREGIRVLLAVVASISRPMPLDAFVARACLLAPQLAGFDPTLIADVARRTGLGAGGA